jgi:hypothetical protein
MNANTVPASFDRFESHEVRRTRILYGDPVCCGYLTADHPLRACCIAIADNPYFGRFILSAVLLNCTTLAVSTYPAYVNTFGVLDEVREASQLRRIYLFTRSDWLALPASVPFQNFPGIDCYFHCRDAHQDDSTRGDLIIYCLLLRRLELSRFLTGRLWLGFLSTPSW